MHILEIIRYALVSILSMSHETHFIAINLSFYLILFIFLLHVYTMLI